MIISVTIWRWPHPKGGEAWTIFLLDTTNITLTRRSSMTPFRRAQGDNVSAALRRQPHLLLSGPGAAVRGHGRVREPPAGSTLGR